MEPKILTFFFDLSDFLEIFFTFVWRWYKTCWGGKEQFIEWKMYFPILLFQLLIQTPKVEIIVLSWVQPKLNLMLWDPTQSFLLHKTRFGRSVKTAVLLEDVVQHRLKAQLALLWNPQEAFHVFWVLVCDSDYLHLFCGLIMHRGREQAGSTVPWCDCPAASEHSTNKWGSQTEFSFQRKSHKKC